MSVLVQEITGVDLMVGAELACFTPEGDVYGLAVVAEGEPPLGLSVKGDDGATQEKDGFAAGDTMVFKYWNPETDAESDVRISQVLNGEPKFAINGLLVCKIEVEEGVDDAPTTLPSGFNLSDPYPNPFNARAEIRFSLPHRGDVNLSLFNLAGQKVRVVAAGRMEAGEHSLELDGGSLPSGMYLLVLSSGSERAVVRAVRVK